MISPWRVNACGEASDALSRNIGPKVNAASGRGGPNTTTSITGSMEFLRLFQKKTSRNAAEDPVRSAAEGVCEKGLSQGMTETEEDESRVMFSRTSGV